MNKKFLEELEKTHKRIVNLEKTNQDFFSNLSMEMNIQSGGLGKILAKIPSENSTKIFILDFRPFLLQGEYVYIPTFCNNLIKNLKDEDNELSEKINNFKMEWNKFYNGVNVGGLATKIDDKQVTVKEKVDLWLNGKFMHPTDKKGNKCELLEKINKPPFGPMDYYFFIDILQRLALCVIWLDKNILIKILDKK